jgi:cell division protease FtsH
MTLSSRHPTGSARPGEPNDRPRAPAPTPPPRWRMWLLPVGIIITLLLLTLAHTSSTPTKNFSYSTFLSQVGKGDVRTASVNPGGAISGTLKGGDDYTSQIPTAIDDTQLAPTLKAHDVDVTGEGSGSTLLVDLLSFLPLLLLVAFFIWIGRRSSKQLAGGIMGFGGSKAKVYDEDRPSTRFADIAGYEGAKREVTEVVDFLSHPERYARAGAIGPRGVLMVGPPGTGKTLVARAVAGEAGVPFLALTGSSFVELFVGVGASRVRDLFADARKRAPSIIFIDEIDAMANDEAAPSSPTTSGSRRSTSSWPRWTGSTPPPASSSWRQLTDPRCSIRPCSDLVASIARSRSRCPTRPSERPFWRSTGRTSI